MKLPARITGFGDPLLVREVAGLTSLGAYEEGTGVVELRAGLPKVGRVAVLVHELLHAVDAGMLAAGGRKRRISHAFITAAPLLLVAGLASTGMLQGITAADVRRFIRTRFPPAPRRRRAPPGRRTKPRSSR